MRVMTKRLRLESRSFRYKVALYLSYLFDEKIEKKLRISSIISDYPASKVKLTSRFSLYLQLEVTVTGPCNKYMATNV